MTTCLIADDNDFQRTLLESAVETFGFNTATVSDGLEALAFCEETMPDIILLDMQMPRMNGITFLNKLLQSNPPKKPYIIICTGESFSEDEKSRIQGADHFLTKPISREKLELVLSKAGLLINS